MAKQLQKLLILKLRNHDTVIFYLLTLRKKYSLVQALNHNQVHLKGLY